MLEYCNILKTISLKWSNFLGFEKVWSTFLDLRFTIKIPNCKSCFLKIRILFSAWKKAYNVKDKLLQLFILSGSLKNSRKFVPNHDCHRQSDPKTNGRSFFRSSALLRSLKVRIVGQPSLRSSLIRSGRVLQSMLLQCKGSTLRNF